MFNRVCDERIVGNNHSNEIVMFLLQMGVGAESVLQAAALHELLNDTDTTVEELTLHFDLQVSTLVKEMSVNRQLWGDKQDGSGRRRAQLMDLLNRMPVMTHSAKTILLGDLFCKVQHLVHRPSTMCDWNVQHYQEYFTWCYKVLDLLSNTHQTIERMIKQLLFGTITLPTAMGTKSRVVIDCLPPDYISEMERHIYSFYQWC